MNDRNVPNPSHKPWTHISNVPIPILLRLLQRKNSKQNAQSQEPTIKPKKWTAEDYKNYEDYRQQQHELEMAYQAAELEREIASKDEAHKRKLASKDEAHKRKLASQAAEDRRLKELLEHAMQYGEVESIEYTKGGYSVVYKKIRLNL
jgi:hypothetical protein